MKALYQAIAVVAILNILAALGGVGYLSMTGRLNGERIEKAIDVFALTLTQEQEKLAEEEVKAHQTAADAERQARLLGLAGPASTAEKLAAEQERHEVLLRQLERTRREIQALQDNLHLSQQKMQAERDELVADKQALEGRLTEMETRLNDEGFKKAVELYEQLPAKQVKQMFLDLMQQDKTDTVVAYLEAMQPRKAAGVLKEFKDPLEVARAVELTERLRARGSDLVQQVETTG